MSLFTILEQRQNNVNTLNEKLEEHEQKYTDQVAEIKKQAQLSAKRFTRYCIAITIVLTIIALWQNFLISLIVIALFWLLNDIDELIMLFRPGLYRKLNIHDYAWVGRSYERNKELVVHFENIKSSQENLDEAVLQRDSAKKDLLLLLQKHLPEIDFSKLPLDAQIDLKQYLEYYVEYNLMEDDEEELDEANQSEDNNETDEA